MSSQLTTSTIEKKTAKVVVGKITWVRVGPGRLRKDSSGRLRASSPRGVSFRAGRVGLVEESFGRQTRRTRRCRGATDLLSMRVWRPPGRLTRFGLRLVLLVDRLDGVDPRLDPVAEGAYRARLEQRPVLRVAALDDRRQLG